jgi:hypothetical protein
MHSTLHKRTRVGSQGVQIGVPIKGSLGEVLFNTAFFLPYRAAGG